MKCLMQSAEVSTKNTFQRLCSRLKALPASYFAPESSYVFSESVLRKNGPCGAASGEELR